jgi:hypothetical protein
LLRRPFPLPPGQDQPRYGIKTRSIGYSPGALPEESNSKSVSGRRRDESEEERLDRNLLELLNELRVALPGVQVLFAFLLTVPFSQRYSVLAPYQEKIYFGTLICSAAATACLIAPSVHHRVEFRMQDKHHIVLLANRLAIIGLAFLALAMTGVVLLITDLLYGAAVTAIVTAATALVFGLLWYGIPVRRRLTRTAR